MVTVFLKPIVNFFLVQKIIIIISEIYNTNTIKNKDLYKVHTIEYKANNINIEKYINFIKNDGNYCRKFEIYITTKIYRYI